MTATQGYRFQVETTPRGARLIAVFKPGEEVPAGYNPPTEEEFNQAVGHLVCNQFNMTSAALHSFAHTAHDHLAAQAA